MLLALVRHRLGPVRRRPRGGPDRGGHVDDAVPVQRAGEHQRDDTGGQGRRGRGPVVVAQPPELLALMMSTPGAATALYARTVEKAARVPSCWSAATAITPG
ncbi:hypothetical protein PV383_38170 [Streptomyces caniscabiei]|uniref:Uncharacterized protein n=1 Tax=Streptomyces caniscabiei TaxID=2746961 RepID=A0ABU4MZJ9_9ACTN|nr:hypothetical protein [Streptomyces caniscabiei]MBE4736844.1 hypothetical protein [Streptomyces caniscabiei]MBE4762073.1 hypothetical protein [Streptomyces caniscabiei]MBE4775416.1 hypothetical protein [Streptomyces caniscabiei]MBE4787039.1 hypothetical protein [Streptomyces caniscabiei]MBE4794706.1 hypothetical protein [Streptomyces caniscabiei]